jgi:hypothetical protein
MIGENLKGFNINNLGYNNWGMLHVFINPCVQTQSNRVCNSLVILLWLMFLRDNFVSRFLYFTTAGVKCCLEAVKRYPVLVISFWSFGIIDASAVKCWELSTTQAGGKGREGCCPYSLSLMSRLNQTRSAILV